MTATAQAADLIDGRVPLENIRPYALQMGNTTWDDPFKTIIPDIHRGPSVLYSPGAWFEAGDAWVFTREEDIRAVFMDTDHFSSKGISPYPSLVGENWGVTPVESDPPAHRGFRNVLTPLFTPQRVAALDDKMRSYVRGFIGEFRDKGEAEIMKDLAARFPIAVFLELFGLPMEEVDQFMAWEFDLLHNANMTTMGAAVRAVKQRLGVEMEARRRNPGNDFISHIVHSKNNGQPLSDDDAFGLCFNLYLGGLDTVTTNIGWQLRHLANDLPLQRQLRADPSLIPQAVEEMLRAYATVAMFRTCTSPVVVGGIPIKVGEKVIVSTSIGSNDPDVFENPMEVRLGRQQRHLGFGTGIHSCVGARLARRELVITLEEFLAAIPDFNIVPGAKILTHLGGVMQQDCLPLEW